MAGPSTEPALAAAKATGYPPPAWLTNVGVVIALGLVVLVSALGIVETATSMAKHGISVNDFQSAGTSAKAEQAYDQLGEEGRRAAWWFLGFDVPFLIGFGLLLSAGCAFAARQLAAAGALRLARIATYAVSLGVLAAASDLIQDSALVFVLLGEFGQPAPRLAEVLGYFAWVFGISAGFVFGAGWIFATLKSRRTA